MPSLALPVEKSPFDAIAPNYDEVFTESSIGRAQRSAVWEELQSAFHPGDRVLEIGCGTGVDACFLAERGVNVLGCDSSAEMIRVATQRVRERSRYFRNASVNLCVRPVEQMESLDSGFVFDGAFSNFGALNCVEDLRRFACDVAARLRPSAKLLLCLMGPCCLWEVAWFLAHGQPGRAIRRFRRGGTMANVGRGGTAQVHYPTVDILTRTLAPEFDLRGVKGIGLCVPPTYASSLTDRFPRLLRLAAASDRLLAGCPGLRVLGDHVLLTFERALP